MKNNTILASTVLLAFSTTAFAEMPSVEAIPDMDTKTEKAPSGFRGMVGLAAANMPEYVGSDETETTGLPLINLSYNDTYYIKFNRIGATWAIGDSGFKLGVELTTRKGWDSSDVKNSSFYDELSPTEKLNIEPALKNDRDKIILFGPVASYKKGDWTAELALYGGKADEVNAGIDDNGNAVKVEPGGEIVAKLGYRLFSHGKFNLTGQLKVEALSEDTVEYLYGVDDSATNIAGTLIGMYAINKKWVVMGAVSVTSLDDTISDSIIVDDDTPTIALLGVAYAF